jgi:23S rRNA (adenine2503-C2)-methyltransferase
MNDEISGAATLPAVPTGAQISLYDLLPEELEAWLAARQQPLFRAKQLYAGIYGHFAEHAVTIPAVPKALGALIDAELPLTILDEVTRTTSADGRTTKLLWRTADGCMIEGVLMHYRDRSTACISSQAGCGYGCTFCATGKMGLTRNLSAGEIVAQVVALARLSEIAGPALTTVV